MVIGIRRGLPFGPNSSKPSARGPLIFFAPPAVWAGAICVKVEAKAAQVTNNRAVRYKVDREEEVPMDINDKAPEFTLPDQNGKNVTLKDLRGKYIVLYFYPRADTPGCTIEACEFRDSYKKVEKTGAVVLGVSPDAPKALKKFEEKYGLPFTLLGDADKKVCNAYGVIQEKNMYGKKVMGVARTTFIIGPEGKIKHIFYKVKPQGHADEVLTYLKSAAQGAA
jgi:thioredoxin-dependent peroxiredoxin